MILFYEDWDDYKHAIVDTKTTNTSFLRLAGLYSKMGIKNHSFILQLHDPSLQGVDPFSPDLTEEQVTAIANECKINFFYYIREIAYAPSNAGGKPFRFRANRGNIALFWLFFSHISTMLIQPRQTGKSFSTDILMRWLLNIGTLKTKINLLTKDAKLRSENVIRLKNIEKEYPVYLRLTNRTDSNNTEGITVKALGNSYTTHIGQASQKLARNVGRGLTSPIFHIDELPHISNIRITLPAALAAGGAAIDQAIESGEPYGTVITTTAGRLDSDSGRYGYEIYLAGAKWTEKFFDSKDEESLELLIRKNSSENNVTVILDFNHRQLGYTDKWLRSKLEAARSKGIDAETDFLNKWSAGTDTSPISKKLLNMVSASEVADFYTEIHELGFITRWYIPESEIERVMSSTTTVMGLDTSDAVGKDDIALVIRDVRTGAVIAVGNYNETNLITFAKFIVSWLLRFPELLLLPERRSSAIMIIDYLIDLLVPLKVNPFKRIFNWVVQEAEMYPERFAEIDKPIEKIDPSLFVVHRKQFGFATSGSGRSSRDSLYGNTLLAAIKYTGDRVHDKSLILQITGLTTRNGRIDHPVGSKDDLCIGWMLSFWFLVNAKNTLYYGIEPKQILISVIAKQETDNPKDVERALQQRKQNDIREKIDFLIEYLKKEKNDIRAGTIVNKIKFLSEGLDETSTQVFNINSLLEDIEMTRRAKSKNKLKYF